MKNEIGAIAEYEELALWRLARGTDPVTSHEAGSKAEATFAHTHELRILAALGSGPAGSSELGDRLGLSNVAVARRMKRLRDLGRIEPDGLTVNTRGNRETRWRLRR